MKLIESQVKFKKEEHTYTLNGKELHGITGMLSRQLFADKYKDVPEYVMRRAAERGTAIHEDCEFADATGLEPLTVEGRNYLKLRKEFKVVANEYTVSDNDYFASNIDCVWEKEGKVFLADIKTTSYLDEEYLSWQLSIYAYLFELQNPELKVCGLYGAWLKDDKYKLVDINRKPIEEIIRLMECEKNGEKFLIPQDEKMLISHSAVDILIEAQQLAEFYTKRYEEIKEQLLKAMSEHNVKSWEVDKLKATRTPGTITETFDSKKFKEENPELYAKYLKKSSKKESIRITIR